MALLKTMFPDDKILPKVTLEKTKCSNRYGYWMFITVVYTNNHWWFYFLARIWNIRKRCTENKTCWKILVCSNRQTYRYFQCQQLAIIVYYWEKCKWHFIIEPVHFMDVKDATAKGSSSSLMEAVEKEDLPTCNLNAFCAYTCNTFIGIHNSVSVILNQQIPQFLNIKCKYSCYCHYIIGKNTIVLSPERQLFSKGLKDSTPGVEFRTSV